MYQDQSDGKFISPTVAEYDVLAAIKAIAKRLSHNTIGSHTYGSKAIKLESEMTENPTEFR
jgi:hypothetical protein